MHDLLEKILIRFRLILLSVVVNWHIVHLAPRQAACHTKCILSELESVLTGVTLTAVLLCFTVIASIAAYRMLALHTVCYSSKQVGLHQISAATNLKLTPLCRK